MPTGRLFWVVSFLLLTLGLTALPAAAQDYLNEPEATAAFLWQNLRNYAAQPAASDMSELAFYLGPKTEGRVPTASYSLLGRTPAEGPSKLVAFTRLAGMFMGRVSPLSIGNMRICFKIDIL